jgi:DNA-directed RNA polymerase sigma subunit (sigma70/sigma32)
MDNRCPQNLTDFPETWCGYAVMRLKAIRNASKELTEEEEAKLVGCPWAINNQCSNYCFFQYVESDLPERTLSDIEVAGLLNISVDTVKKIEKNGLEKLKKDSVIQEYSADFEV